MVRLLTPEEFHSEAESIFSQIFKITRWTVPPSFSTEITSFKERIEASVIIYRIEIDMNLSLITAVVNAALSLEDEGCYVYNDFGDYFCCHVSFSELLESYKLPEPSIVSIAMEPTFLEGYIFSDRGNWGVHQCSEKFAIIGGSNRFVKEVCRAIPDVDEQARSLLRDYQFQKQFGHFYVEWLPELLIHAYGKETAENLLKEFGLP